MLNSLDMLHYEQIPVGSEVLEGWDKTQVKVMDDKLVEIDFGKSKRVYIHHTRTTIPDNTVEEIYESNGRSIEVEPEEKEIDLAYAINCPKPVTYSRLISYGIHQEFSVEDGEIESINRKRYTDPDDPEIKVHDSLVKWLKDGLKEIGYGDK